MPSHFEIIATKTRLQLSQAGPDTPSYRILSLLNELLAALQLEETQSPEVDDLKSQVENLTVQTHRLNEQMNHQAGILHAVKAALEADDSITMAQLPAHATKVLQWAKMGEKPVW